MTTDLRVTSHGCGDLLVYTGDGSAFVYSTVHSDPCSKGILADFGIGVLDVCANDDIILTGGIRFTPSTQTQVYTQEKTCSNS
jgi:hypothetical protein